MTKKKEDDIDGMVMHSDLAKRFAEEGPSDPLNFMDRAFVTTKFGLTIIACDHMPTDSIALMHRGQVIRVIKIEAMNH